MERINIVTVCDEAFAQHNCVLLASLVSHNPALVFDISIIVPESFSEESRLKTINSLTLGNSVLQFNKVYSASVPDVKIDSFIPKVTYYKLLISEILPRSASLALYLDSDIIINGDISDLVKTDLSGHAIAAVPDAWVDRDASIRKKIGLKKGDRYINSGVLLINLDLWRSNDIGRRAIEYCAANHNAITFHDQCALNHVVQGDCKILDEKWNFQSPHLLREYTYSKQSLEEAKSAIVIHFTTASKPWHFMCTHPMKHLYFTHLRNTLWRNFTEKDRTVKNYIKKPITRFPAVLVRLIRDTLVPFRGFYARASKLRHAWEYLTK